MSFVSTVQQTMPGKEQVGLFWLGQAGFLLKTSTGKTIAIDPYFSHYVERAIPEEGLGFKRLSPAPCTAEELDLDVLLISHEHADHFDQDSIRGFMASGKTHVYTNAPCADIMREMGLDMNRVHVLKKNEPVQIPDCTLTAMDCDHGELAPEALGLMLDFGFTKVYYAGDTALTLDRLATPIAMKPEVAILPINGAFGNLDGYMAAEYAGLLNCKICVPCHFWTFPLHHGDPQQIIDSIGEKAPNCALKLLCQGEGILV